MAILELEGNLEKADRSRKVAGLHQTEVNEVGPQVPCTFYGLYENGIVIVKVASVRSIRWM